MPRSGAAREPLAGPEEVAEYLAIPAPTLAAWRSRGGGPKFAKIGVHVRYKWVDVDSWLEDRFATGKGGVAAEWERGKGSAGR